MKSIVVFGFIISLLWPAFAQTATAEDSYSLSHWLVPWYGELRPGGAVLIGANPIFDSDETTAETWFKPISYATGVVEDEGRTIIWNGDGTGGHDPYWVYIDQWGYLVAHVSYELPYQVHKIKSANPLDLNVWHHFALVISVTETSLYFDGEKQQDVFLNAGSACKGTGYLALGRSMRHWR